MPDIKFKYDDWDPKKDVPLFRPGTELGYSLIRDGHRVSRAPTRGQGGKVERDGVIGLLAGALEWLRQYGLTAEEVQEAVLSFEKNNRDTKGQKFQLTVERIRDISDVNAPKERLNPKKDWNRHFVN